MKHFLLFFVFNLIYIYSYSSDILVNNSGADGTYLSIEEAVEAAENGDRILISPSDFPFNIDTLVINKNLTLMPYSSNSFVQFKGNINLILDSITEFTIIGFRFNSEYEWGIDNLYSTMTDTSRDFLSTINIIDCKILNIRMDQPKTSTYLSYSEVSRIAFSHGDIIGNKLHKIYFGNFDYGHSNIQPLLNCNYEESECVMDAPMKYWSFGNSYYNNLNNSLSSECDLFSKYVPFGNSDVITDTCNIIANYFAGNSGDIYFFNLDFPFNFRNNYIKESRSFVFLTAPTSRGVNQIINNVFYYGDISSCFAYCEINEKFNFSDVRIEVLNNYFDDHVYFHSPSNSDNDYYSFQFLNESNFSYNNLPATADNFAVAFFNDGPTGSLPSNGNPKGEGNPSLKYLNLDLTTNSIGTEGGSHAWSNYHGLHLSFDWRINRWGNPNLNFGNEVTEIDLLQDLVDYNLNGYLGDVDDGELNYNYAGRISEGGRARITYLNLPTQIFNPSNIKVKARAIHGN